VGNVEGEKIAAAIERVARAPKYSQIHIDTIADVVRREAPYAQSTADLERRARLRLHKVMAGYLVTGRPARLLRGLDDAIPAGPDAVRTWCRGVLAAHISSAERLPDLDRFYPAILDLTGPVGSVADLACALNPLTVPWLRQSTAAQYTGYDLNLSYVKICAEFLARTATAATVRHHDVLVAPEEIYADLVLLLKTYHCIEDRAPGAALRLVELIPASFVVVSFPVRTMSGRIAHFTRRHTDELAALAAVRHWDVRRASLANEDLMVIVKKDDRGSHD
jgi:16S rRNA (guanine(1405)-N(7))-methyltransferase